MPAARGYSASSGTPTPVRKGGRRLPAELLSRFVTFDFKPYTREEFIEATQEAITAPGGVPVQTISVDVRDVGAMDAAMQEIAIILRVRAASISARPASA
jgi:hypothetical protein